MIEETDNKQGMQVKCIYLVGKWVISAMERNQTGKKERMPGLSKVIRESSLRRRHRRKDPKKGRERAMRKHGEWGLRGWGGSGKQSAGHQGGPGLACHGNHEEHK